MKDINCNNMNMNTSNDPEDAIMVDTTMDIKTTTTTTSARVETLQAMLEQEQSYHCDDYMNASAHTPLHVSPSLAEDRSKMVAWQYQVADFCRFSRETVAIASNYFDRFLASSSASEALTNTDLFQLAAMTCFYTAAKLHEPESFEPWMLSKMSRGLYTATQVETMELVLLQALQWRMHPPTCLSFVREYLELLPHSYLPESARPAVMDLCQFQCELIVRLYEFAPVKASTLALAALLNSLESLGMEYAQLQQVEAFLQNNTLVESREDVQMRLYQAVTDMADTHSQSPSSNSTSAARQTLSQQENKAESSSYQSSPCAVVQMDIMASAPTTAASC